ncbi:SCF E3 ubiquitin ligase complex F-box protein grrA [Smittium mucronatum]|uniref:SCF E3 ubiquitin ligase complex F-box protein grrA n=1 Tax=Smittium mucronatum TaxID=133383 RepID=A0A1R0GWA4_9FUNG|nr:SCF E3 ubiquitin ligase complex F-box protein grrA [Smittium mucronatum]
MMTNSSIDDSTDADFRNINANDNGKIGLSSNLSHSLALFNSDKVPEISIPSIPSKPHSFTEAKHIYLSPLNFEGNISKKLSSDIFTKAPKFLNSLTNAYYTKSKVLDLNPDILERIFKCLSQTDLKSASLVCHFWNQTSVPLLWKRVIVPLDKRKLSAMKPILNNYGRFVKSALIVPPIEILTASTGPSGILNIPVAGSKKRNDSWSLPRPLFRSDSVSSMQSLSGRSPLISHIKNSSVTKSPYLSRKSSLDDFKFPQKSLFPNSEDCSGSHHRRLGSSSRIDYDDSNMLFYNSDSDSANYESSSTFKSYSNFQTSSNYQNDFPLATDDLSMNNEDRISFEQQMLMESQRQMHNHSSLSNSSRGTIPIPGTPGVGNLMGTEASSSPSFFSKLNIDSSLNGSMGSSSIYSSRSIIVTRSTVIRLQQIMECYCPNITDLTILNPNGIPSHDLRIEFLECLFSIYPNLMYLNLTDFIMWDSKAMRLISSHLNNLRSLDVTNRVELTDDDFDSVIRNCHNLSELHLRATNITDLTIKSIQENISKNLKIIDVSGCSVSSEAMSQLLSKACNLTELRAWSCLRLNDDFLNCLIPRNLSSLKVLDLMDIHGFSNSAICSTFGLQKWPNLKYLRIRSSLNVDSFSGLPKDSILILS